MQSTTFTVDAALLRELGDRLIGRSYIALAELVKNAYDADATDCRIELDDDRIVVWDNGHGMSEQDFHRHWLRIGTTHKTAAPASPRLARAMTGSKGLGRLSVQFLADEMTLESTSVDDSSRHLYASVDWTVNGRRKVTYSRQPSVRSSPASDLFLEIDGEEDAGCGRCGKPRSSRFSKLPVGALFASMGSVGVHGPGVGRQRCVRVA